MKAHVRVDSAIKIMHSVAVTPHLTVWMDPTFPGCGPYFASRQVSLRATTPEANSPGARLPLITIS